jgi:hypothetical protein
MTMRTLIGIMLAAALLAGCATWSSMPYNAREACVGSGGTYTAGGGCEAGLE